MMLRLGLHPPDTPLRRILCLGAHCDDIEIGCGGTILRLLGEYPGLEVSWVVFSSTRQRRREAQDSARLFLGNVKPHKIVVKGFRDSHFPYQGSRIKDFFEVLKGGPSPDLIFTHFRHDLHQDHRLISDLTWNAFRSHLIFEYEIPKYDGDLGSPNFFVGIGNAILTKKIGFLLKAFKSQKNKHWFSEDTFRALPRLRGIESNAAEKYAEAFYCRKAIL
jgi:LmbE family N-acetylglucosaminyl deacetylase